MNDWDISFSNIQLHHDEVHVIRPRLMVDSASINQSWSWMTSTSTVQTL